MPPLSPRHGRIRHCSDRPVRNDGLTAAAVTARSHRMARWRCGECGSELRAKVFHRVRGMTTCPSCSGRVCYQACRARAPRRPVVRPLPSAPPPRTSSCRRYQPRRRER
ncbi:zinc-ribbon domain-containing protein [Streptomyces sp. NPDC004285]